ncbi:MAG: peptide deformylase [Spirochaetes bacterium]|nr:peptide deformylase [Spirochaetota bacterium]
MQKIIIFDDHRLNQKSEVISEINDDIIQLANDMQETMSFSNGIGLAAVQVGVLKRLFIIDIPDVGKYTMINPVINDKSIKTNVFEEGCLSLPGIASEVERSKTIYVEYTDLKGNRKTLEATALLATCIQHELDHLEGILFIDRLPPEIKLEKIREYRKLHIV